MAHNENQTPEVQQAIRRREEALSKANTENHGWWIQLLRDRYHPNIKGLRDYGIAALKPETEAYCRDLCERNRFSYDEIKGHIAARTQVIQARQRNPISSELIGKNVWPINRLDALFKAAVQGAVSIKRQLRNERAQEVIKELTGVN